ncbi:transposase [Shewanella sp. SR43-8]|uniref:IS66 family transposase n=1 Tax=Shewanella sp. SR43-8 TaxID=2760938 RepID=UPI001C727067|nr:transposase [Shewanella sp. SR43-8]
MQYSKATGSKITASTVFDQVELVCNDIYPVYQQLFNLASDAEHYYLDDTTHRILDAKPVEKAVSNSDKTRLHSGIYTSGVITLNTIILFETNIGHAGEFIDSILHKRSQSCGKSVIMSDALPSNSPTATEATMSMCNIHARLQFVDVINHFPEDVEYVLVRNGEIWMNDDYVKSEQLSPSARLSYDQTHSLPIMEDINLWGRSAYSE